MNTKTKLGQFNTTKKDYILSGFENFVNGKECIDPYAGGGDLLTWALKNGAKEISGYDIDFDKRSDVVSHRDTLLNPVDLTGKFVIANPPYLAKNKSKDKSLYNKYQQDDLYKIAMLTCMSCKEGIFIVPLNFLCSTYANSIRELFFDKYHIVSCKVFEEAVFEDTDYTVCAFYFKQKSNKINKDTVKITFLPSNKNITYNISLKHHWILGEEFYDYINNVNFSHIERWTIANGSNNCTFKNEEEKYIKQVERGTIYINDFVKKVVKKGGDTDEFIINGPKQNAYFKTEILKDIILLEAIDTGTANGLLGLVDIRTQVRGGKYPILLGLNSSRNLAHIRFKEKLDFNTQLKIIDVVNNKIKYFREKYNSVFLTAFRNSANGMSRKRISFECIYKLIAKAIEEINNN